MAAAMEKSPFDVHRTTSAIFSSFANGPLEKEDWAEEVSTSSKRSARGDGSVETKRGSSAAESEQREKTRKRRRVTSAIPSITGDLASLPEEVLELILMDCGPKELGALTATCTYFTRSQLTERAARQQLLLDAPVHAFHLRPGPGESWSRLLHYVMSFAEAREQMKAVSMGAYHTTVLGAASTSAPGGAGSGRGGRTTGLILGTKPELYSFGRGFHGQLGQGDYAHHDLPQTVRLDAPQDDASGPPQVEAVDGERPDVLPAAVSCGNSHSCVVGRGGELMTWGLASSGELGHGGWTPIELCVPRQVAALSAVRVVQVSTGANHTLAVGACGGLWSSGRGRMGQLGHGLFHDAGPLQRVDSLRGMRVLEAAAGGAHSLARVADGSVYSWGDARHGQLGLGDLAEPAVAWPRRIESLQQVVMQLCAGGAHSLAVTVEGTLLSFGRGRHGALGLGDTVDRRVPTVVAVRLASILSGNDRAPARGRGGKRAHRHSQECRVVQVAAGANHTIALVHRLGSTSLEVYSAGSNNYGQLGHGDVSERLFLHMVREFKRAGAGRVTAVVAGQDHSGAVCQGGRLYMWGRGDWGQLGHGNKKSQWSPAEHRWLKVAPPLPEVPNWAADEEDEGPVRIPPGPADVVAPAPAARRGAPAATVKR